jgi:hypothetical protein
MNHMSSDARITDLTAGAADVLTDGQFVVLDQDDLDLGALAPRLQSVHLPDNDVVVLGAFSPEVATQVTRIANLITQQKEQRRYGLLGGSPAGTAQRRGTSGATR